MLQDMTDVAMSEIRLHPNLYPSRRVRIPSDLGRA